MIDWNGVFKNQDLSEDFIIDHSDKIDWCNRKHYEKVVERFIKKHVEKTIIMLLVQICSKK